MSTISNEQAKDLRNAFECWQQDYDPVEDKEQYDMFGLGIVAMDELLALRKERERAEPIVKAAEKLVRCKGRYHSEQNYRALAALFGVTTPDLPPLESDVMREKAEPVAVVNSNMRRICKKCSASIVGYSVDGLCEDCYLAALPATLADDSLPYDPQVAEYEQMMEAEQAQTDTTSKQFESLAGQAVSEDASSMADAHMAWLNTNFPRNAYSDEEWEEVSLYTWLAWRDSQRKACFPGT